MTPGPSIEPSSEDAIRATLDHRVRLMAFDEMLFRGIELANKPEGFRVRLPVEGRKRSVLFTPRLCPLGDARHAMQALGKVRDRKADYLRLLEGWKGAGSLGEARRLLVPVTEIVLEVPPVLLVRMKEWTSRGWLNARIRETEETWEEVRQIARTGRRRGSRLTAQFLHALDNDLDSFYFPLWFSWFGKNHRSDRRERGPARSKTLR